MTTKVIVHCSDSPDNRADIDAEEIHRWHTKRRWSGIGYHYVIKRDGILENGRPEYWTGAHVRSHNKDSIGICMIGRERFTTEQFDTLFDLIQDLNRRHLGISLFSHFELDDRKTCPNFDARAWYEKRLSK